MDGCSRYVGVDTPQYDEELKPNLEPYLFYLDLSTNVTVESFLSPSILQRYSLPSDMTPNAAIGNKDYDTFLWYSKDTVYAPNLGAAGNTIAAFDTTKGDWRFLPVSGVDVYSKDISSALNDPSSEMSASIPSSGLAFSFGGFGLPGLVKFNNSVPRSLTWTNQTSGGSPGIQVPVVSEAEMVYVPLGKEGVLLVIGGMDVRFLPSRGRGCKLKTNFIGLASSRWHSDDSSIPNICLRH